MRTLGNIIWLLILQGWFTAGLTYIVGLLLTLTGVGAPIGLGLMEYGKFLFWPFGKAMVSKKDLNIEQNAAWKAYSMIVTIVYFPVGLVLFVLSLVQIVILFITLIGIPTALVLAKSLGTVLNPVNKKCVSTAVADEMERRKAQEQLDNGNF